MSHVSILVSIHSAYLSIHLYLRGCTCCMRSPRAHTLAHAHLHSHVHTRKTSLTHPQAHSRPELTSAMDHHRSERDGLAPAIDARNSAAGNPGGARPPTTAQAMMFVGIAPRPWPSASSQPQTSSAPNMIGNPGGAQAPTTAFKAVAGVGDAAHVDLALVVYEGLEPGALRPGAEPLALILARGGGLPRRMGSRCRVAAC